MQSELEHVGICPSQSVTHTPSLFNTSFELVTGVEDRSSIPFLLTVSMLWLG